MINCFKCAQLICRKGFHSQIPMKGSKFPFPANTSYNLVHRSYSRSYSSSPRPPSAREPDSASTPTSEPTLEDLDKPIQFTTSRASTWTAYESHMGAVHRDVPWFQPWIVLGSVGCLLLWFTIFREENDMDEEIGKTLWERIPGLEKQQLLTLKKYNLQHSGTGTTVGTEEIDKRLKELEEKEKRIQQEKAKST